MRAIIWFISLAAIAFACSGDCLACHASLGGTLGKDRDHASLLECVSCHEEIDSPKAECGGNCFACHAEGAIDKTVSQHESLGECKACHISASGGDVLGKFLNLGDTLDEKLKRMVQPPK
jgi:hypothetical protein